MHPNIAKPGDAVYQKGGVRLTKRLVSGIKSLVSQLGIAGEVKSFRQIIVTAVLLAAILPTCMAAIPLIVRLGAEIKAGAERELQLRAERTAGEVEHELWLVAQHALDLSKDSGLRKLSTRELRSETTAGFLQDYLLANKPVAEVFLLSPGGSALNAWPRSSASSPVRPDWLAWLKEADHHDGKLNGAEIQFLPEEDSGFLDRTSADRGTMRSARFLTLFVPVRAVGAPRLVAVIAAVIPWENVARCHQYSARPGGWVDFFDGEHNLIERLPGDVSRGARAQLFARADFRVTHGARGLNIPLSLRLSEPAHLEREALKKGLWPTVIGLVVALTLLALFVIRSSRRLTAPISKLTAHARAINAGDYLTPPPQLKFQELQDLAHTLGELGSRVTVEIQKRVEQETAKGELEKTRVESALHSMMQQMQPHFLFNCLNTIAAVIPSDAALAAEMTQHLSDLYRLILKATKQATSPLQQEIEIVIQYLELQKLRYGHRLTYALDLPAPMPPLLLPSLMLQTLTENAVKHGIARVREGGKILIKVEVSPDGRYRVQIRNSGAPLVERESGTGLKNSRRRLDLLFGPAHEFFIGSSAGETVVEFFIPGVTA